MAKRVPTCSEKEGFVLLDQLQSILEHDPQIDEVGFIHSSQLVVLKEGEEASTVTSTGHKEDARLVLAPSKANEVEGKDAFFWSKEHKLGISTEFLLPLYKAAKNRFMDAYLNYKKMSSFSLKNESAASSCEFSGIEIEVMKQSKALLLLSSDFGTAWNARKLIISKREEFSIADELLVSTLVISFAPKSESAWNYRRWIINRIAGKLPLEAILKKESDLVEKIAENSKMNYRAWNHRCWLIAYMTSEQALRELNANRNWAALHVADNSCFHYRRAQVPTLLQDVQNYCVITFLYLSKETDSYKLMLRMLDEVSRGNVEVTLFTQFEHLQQLWKDELDWNEVLIRRYIGREALWLHRRFLAVCWVKHFGTNNIMWKHLSDKGGGGNNVSIFIDNEVGLVRDCLTLSDSIFEDIESQAIHSAAYILWLNREICSPSTIDLNQKLGIGDLRTFLNKMCPEKVRVWDCLLGEHTSRDTAY